MGDGEGRDSVRRGPVALVTGAAGAIGGALLARLAAVGARTVGTDVHDDGPLSAQLWVAGDVTVPADMERVVATTLNRFGRLDLLILNAGITALGSFQETGDGVFRRVFDVNLHGAIHGARAALPALSASQGRIVVMSSVAGFAPVIGRPAYTASKHAVTGLFESLRHELRPTGVAVTVVYPTFLTTSPADENRPGGAGIDRTVTGPLLRADEVARDVIRGVRRGRDRVYPGALSKLAAFASRFAPDLYARAMVRRLGES